MTNKEEIHKFPYKWNLTDGYPAKGIDKNNCNVFGTFICGGGSTMGYKLAGFNHLGGVEIDAKVADLYKANHSPMYLYNEDIRIFNKHTDLPKELYNLDILDGSPPCSTFSMAGSREEAWGKEKQFREGQAMQTLDDLVFTYCDTIIKLQPKVFVLENVKGIIQGNAKVYAKNIVKKMTDAGYIVQVFCLNAASMGVPQKRERVFFIGHKKDFTFPKLILLFNENPILFGEFGKHEHHTRQKSNERYGDVILRYKEVANTICGTNDYFVEKDYQKPTQESLQMIGTYPLDYNFKELQPKYLIGMSVPPIMMAQIAHQIWLQWLSKLPLTKKP
jgi:DNA (cytosine-5)-methyltransferase 1